jgi:hypothetical protein
MSKGGGKDQQRVVVYAEDMSDETLEATMNIAKEAFQSRAAFASSSSSCFASLILREIFATDSYPLLSASLPSKDASTIPNACTGLSGY